MRYFGAIIRKINKGNCKKKNERLGSIPRMLFFPAALALILVLATALPAFAVDEQMDCELIPKKQYNDRLDCKMGNLVNKVGEVVELMTDDEMTMLSANMKDNLMDKVDRARRAKDRSNSAQAFSQFARRQMAGQGCFFQESDIDVGNPQLDGDNDGVCEKNENCVEEFGDGDGFCQLKGPKKDREVCLQVCDQPDLLDETDDDIFDEEAAEDFEATFDDATDNLEDLRKEMEEKMEVLRNLRRFNDGSISLAATTDYCDNVDQDREDTFLLQVIAVDAAIVAEAAHNQCDSALNNDIAGFNGSVACLVTATISGIVNLFPAAFELLESEINAMTLDASAKCLEQTDDKIGKNDDPGENAITLFGKLNDLQVKAGKTDEKLDSILIMIDEIKTLLNTAQGQREGFPSK